LHRALPLQPLNPALHHALALAHEAIGDPVRAAAAAALALLLLQKWPEARVPGSPLLVPPRGFKGPLLPLKLDYARILAKCDERDKALALFREAEEAGVALGTYELLAYAVATGGPGGADAALVRRATAAAKTPEEAEAAAAAAAAAEAPATAADASGVGPATAKLPPAAAARVWLAAGTAALSRSDAAAAARCAAAAVCAACAAPDGAAALAADAAVLRAAAAPDASAATRAACAAVHICPSSTAHHAIALRTAAAAPTSAAMATRLCSASSAPAAAGRLACRHAGPPFAGNDGSNAALAAAAALRDVRSRPWNLHSWYLSSVLLSQSASQGRGSAARAAAACEVTLRMLQASNVLQAPCPVTHIHLARSVALLATGDAAASKRAAASVDDSADEPLAQLQVARAATATDDAAAAAAALRAAAAAGAAPAALQLLQLPPSARDGPAREAAHAILSETPSLQEIADAIKDGAAAFEVATAASPKPFAAVWLGAAGLGDAALLSAAGHLQQRKAAGLAQTLLRNVSRSSLGRPDLAVASGLLEAEVNRLQGQRVPRYMKWAKAWANRGTDVLAAGGILDDSSVSYASSTVLRFVG
jgi:hypothetical protein